MLNQMYYATRNNLLIRIIALVITIVGNVFFLIFIRGVEDTYPWQFVLAVMFASFAFIGLLVVNLIASHNTTTWLFKNPRSYLMELAPVAAWKKLFGTLIPTVLMDVVSFFIGIVFIVLIVSYVEDVNLWGSMDITVVYAALLILIVYGYLSAMGMLSYVFAKTVFARMPISLLWGSIASVVSAVALSWISIIMLPFGEMRRFGPFFVVEIISGSFVPYVLSLILLAAQGAIFVLVSAYLLDRRA